MRFTLWPCSWVCRGAGGAGRHLRAFGARCGFGDRWHGSLRGQPIDSAALLCLGCPLPVIKPVTLSHLLKTSARRLVAWLVLPAVIVALAGA